MDGKRAGFAVFRRNRLIFGSDDEPWRPLKIITAEGSAVAKRLYGELHFDDDMEVTHTKDNLNWSEFSKINLPNPYENCNQSCVVNVNSLSLTSQKMTKKCLERIPVANYA